MSVNECVAMVGGMQVFALAEQELLSECAKESGLSYNNVDLRLHASGGPLIAFIDTVVGHDEF